MSSTVSAVPTAAGGAGGADGEAAKKKSKLPMVVIAVLVLALAGGAAYFFVLKPKSAAAATTKKVEEPPKGAVVPVDAINVNLANGHYLKLGFALQLTKTKESPDPSQADDIAISLFSGQDMDKLSDPDYREKLKTKFTKAVEKAYEEKGKAVVIDVYYTSFVMQ